VAVIVSASRRVIGAPGAATSLYVHVPFCVVKCGYCDFNSYVVEDQQVVDRFLDALAAELEWRGDATPPPTVFIGGGTPSHLDLPRLERLFAVLGKHVDLARCAEVTIEANPESIDRNKATVARAAGVNRVSMGVQSFDARHLRFLDRAHSADRARAAFAELRAAGFDNISIDLMFGVPGQTVAEWEADLAAALQLGPDHLSCYNLTYEPGTRLTHELQRGRLQPNDEQSDHDMFLRTREVLGAAGFVAYEVSNFAGRGGPCRHNDHYWLQGDYTGVGPGAASHRAGVRSTNLKTVDGWARSLLSGLPPTATAETLTPRQRAGEAVWLGIRRHDGIELEDAGRRLQVPMLDWFESTLRTHVRNDWITWNGGRIALTQRGLLFADRVGAAYLAGAAR